MVKATDGFPTFTPDDMKLLQHPIDREYFAVFALCVPRKPYLTTWWKVQQLLSGRKADQRPFRYLAYLDKIGALKQACQYRRLGQYRRIVPRLRAFTQLPASWNYRDLESLIGLKSARMVGLYWSPSNKVFPLDVHTRRKLYELYPDDPTWATVKNVAFGSLTRTQYDALEALAVKHAAGLGVSLWKMDKLWWQAGVKLAN